MLRTAAGAFGLTIALLGLPARITADDAAERLFAAAREGDLAVIRDVLDGGLHVDSKTRYGATALTLASDRGHVEAVRLLLERGAKTDLRDSFYQSSPMTWAAMNGHAEVVRLLVEKGASRSEALSTAIGRDKAEVVLVLIDLGEPVAAALDSAVAQNKPQIVKAILSKSTPDKATLDKVLATALAKQQSEMVELLKAAGATPPEVVKIDVARAKLKSYAGSYQAPQGEKLEITLKFRELSAAFGSEQPQPVRAVNETKFALDSSDLQIEFQLEGEKIAAAVVVRGSESTRYERSDTASPMAAVVESAVVKEPATARVAKPTGPRNWPSFRGPNAGGVADGQEPPMQWDVTKSENVAWKTPIPGLGHSGPIVWKDRVFVTTAESGDPNSLFKPGAYGDVDSVDDKTVHKWSLFCLDRHTGKVLWQSLAHEGVPRFKRHMKSSHANATPATDGQHVVASFGAEGVYCYDFKGRLLWKLAMDSLNSGWFFQPDYEWGFGSSPLIYGNWVILQCDSQQGSFIAAYELATGREVWKTSRDEVPTWGSPAIFRHGATEELVTNGTRAIRGYDPKTGRELWNLTGNSEITVPTPVFSDELMFVMAGYRPIQPIYAVRAGGKGDLTLPTGEEKTEQIAWSKRSGGPYMPTPLVYKGHLYVLADGGVLTCYDAGTGEKHYSKRVGGQYTASPVVADGRLYLTSEEGKVSIVRTGKEYELLGECEVGETCMASPAICDGVLIMRTQHHLIALGKPRTPPVPPAETIVLGSACRCACCRASCQTARNCQSQRGILRRLLRRN